MNGKHILVQKNKDISEYIKIFQIIVSQLGNIVNLFYVLIGDKTIEVFTFADTKTVVPGGIAQVISFCSTISLSVLKGTWS